MKPAHNVAGRAAHLACARRATVKRDRYGRARGDTHKIPKYLCESRSSMPILSEMRSEHLSADMLPDRQRFVLDEERWKAFLAALDAPVRPLPRLERLLRTPSVFEAPTR